MITRYSKSSDDIALETSSYLEKDHATVVRQRELSQHLLDATPRRDCLLCDQALTPEPAFRHRGVPYAQCSHCGHVQVGVRIPDENPHQSDDDVAFDTIYPTLERHEFESRRDRIYRPKLEWALEGLDHAGTPRNQALALQWLELGPGAGYFIDALLQAGATSVSGCEYNGNLVGRANASLGGDFVSIHQGSLGSAVRDSNADVVVAFFVLEHLTDTDDFWDAMAGLPSGTAFVFSVPTFSLATVLECAFIDHAARNLDNVVHTQLYTDASIAFALDRAGYDIAAEWIFGQDASDLLRAILVNTKDRMSVELHHELTSQLEGLADPFQEVVDQQRFADSRHIVAIKK